MRWSISTAAALGSLISMNAVAVDTAATAALAPVPQLNRADAEAWLDGFMPYAIGSGDIAGAVVAVVKDGQPLLLKGYGYADVERKVPVDPQRTLFRAGSVAKLITYTAVMQQVERGQLDLDADASRYLDLTIPPAFDKPVTLHTLMTHTAGFEELVRGLMNSEPQMLPALEQYAKSIKPARIYPPGEIPSYCNYCVTLTGYIVQRVAGESFDDYLDRHIFAPLGMEHSTFRQPLPEQLAPLVSKSYVVASQPPRYFELVGPAPAGSLSTTGADMARFMGAYLKAAKGEANELMKPETAQLMLTRMLRVAPPTNGMAVGFFERNRNGRRILGHGGDTQFFHSDLLLFVDDGVGLFMSFNSSGKDGATYRIRDALLEDFADRYFPAPVPDEPTAASAVEHAREVAGRYVSSRRAETTFFWVLNLLSQTQVVAKEDGTLVTPAVTGRNGQPKVWREVGPYVWREVGGQERMAAQMQDGRVRLLGLDSMTGIMVMLPVPFSQSGGWIVPLIAVASMCLLLTAIFWPIGAVLRRRRGVALSGIELHAHRLSRAAALVSLIFLAGWAGVIMAGMADLAAFGGGLDSTVALLNALGVLATAGVALTIWNARVVLRSERPRRIKVWSALLATSCVVVAWFGFAFNLVGIGARY